MKSLFILSVFFLSGIVLPDISSPDFFDPTGTYVLLGTVKKNKITGHSGEIRVQLLDSNRVALCFYMNKGYPGYESGSFTDTLPYADSSTRYTPTPDSACSILFYFHPRTVEIIETYSDPHSGCGFARGVLVSAIFKKSSAERPVIQDLSNHGIVP